MRIADILCVENIENIGDEWQRDKQRKSFKNADSSRVEGYQVGTVQPQPRHPAPVFPNNGGAPPSNVHPSGPPEYKAPPQYQNPMTNAQYQKPPPNYQQHQQKMLQLKQQHEQHQQHQKHHNDDNNSHPQDWYVPQKRSSPSPQASDHVNQRPQSLNLDSRQHMRSNQATASADLSKSQGHLAAGGQGQGSLTGQGHI